MFDTMAVVADPDLTSEGIERLRRSVAMLAPRHPGGLNRETAMTVLEELQRVQRRRAQLEGALREVVDDLQLRVETLLDGG